MKNAYAIVFAFLLFGISGMVFAQRHQARKHGFSMKVWINNVGAMGRVAVSPFRSVPNPPPDSLGLEYPGGRLIEHIFGAGLWIGGILDTTRGPGSNPPLRLVTLTYEGWVGPHFEMYPGSSIEDTLNELHNASRHDTVAPAGWNPYWGGALPFRPISDHDIYYTYTDTARSVSGHIPLKLKVIQSSFTWNEPSADGIDIIEYKIMNMGIKVIDSAYIGLFVEADVGPISTPFYWTRNYSGYYSAVRTAYSHNPVDLGSTPVGLQLLGSSQPYERFTFRWFPGNMTPPSDVGKYAWLSSGEIMPDEYPNLSDTRFVVSVGPILIRPSSDPAPDTVIVAFGVVSGLSLTALYQNAVRADSLYRRFLTTVQTPSAAIPETFSLYQNYPNPFNPTTIISFELPSARYTTLKVYDVLGREVATLVDGVRHAGYHETLFDASRLSTGVYVYKITAGDFFAVRKLVVLK